MPTFVIKHGRYSLSWAEPDNIDMDFDLLRADRRSGDVTAELAVRSTAPTNGLLHRARLNLTSTRGITEMVNVLRKRTPGTNLDWNGLLLEACTKVLDRYRAGEPAIQLRDAEPPPEAGVLLDPLLLGRHPNLLFGDGGTGKSYLALALALSLHTGQPLLGIQPKAAVRVAYLDWEFEAWEHRHRMQLLVGLERGRDQLPDLVYRRCSGPLRDQADQLRRLIANEGIGFVVIDSVALACDGAPEEASSALAFFDALRTLEVGSLNVAHVNRQQDASRPFGSTFWHNSARATWYVKGHQEGQRLELGLFNKKANTAHLHRPLGFRFSFGAERTEITRLDVRDVPELAADVPLKDRMARLVARAPKTFQEAADALDTTPDAIRITATRNQGKLFTLLTTTKPHRFALVAHPNSGPEQHPNVRVMPLPEQPNEHPP
jgi:hypothetical protein